MSLRLSAMDGSQLLLGQINRSQGQLEKSIKKLASGSELVGRGASAATFVLSEKLNSQIESLRASNGNIEQAISMAQVAEAGLNEQSNILLRIRELALQASSEITTDAERDQMANEASKLNLEFDRIAKITKFGSRSLLQGSGTNLTFQVGSKNSEDDRIRVTLDADTRADSVNLDFVSLSSADDAYYSLTDIQNAQDKVNEARSKFGVFQAQMEHALNYNREAGFALEEAHSKMADVDIAKEMSEYTRSQIQTEVQIAVLGQANSMARSVLKLFNPD